VIFLSIQTGVNKNERVDVKCELLKYGMYRDGFSVIITFFRGVATIIFEGNQISAIVTLILVNFFKKNP